MIRPQARRKAPLARKPISSKQKAPEMFSALVERLRGWRDDAFNQRLFESASFWGDKLLCMSGIKFNADDLMDAFCLARIFYAMQQFHRADHMLNQRGLVDISIWSRHLSAQCNIQIGNWQQAVDVLQQTELPNENAMDIKLNHTDGKTINITSSCMHLLGVACLHLGIRSQAKSHFLNSLEIEPRCYEALDALVTNQMLTGKEEKELIEGLQLETYPDHEAEFIRSLYISRLTKVAFLIQFNDLSTLSGVHARLGSVYKLAKNPAILLAQAEILMIQCDFIAAFKIISSLYEKDPHNMDCVILYVVCQCQLSKKNELFMIAHQLVDLYPEKSIPWFAVGTYYFSIGKYMEARNYYSKATLLDPNFGAAWIGFAHSFSLGDEHDQALSAYCNAARILPGNHLPTLYLGMQHAKLSHWVLAEEFLGIALETCSTDPLVYNEIGVLHYHQSNFSKAISYLEKVIELVTKAGTPLLLWSTTLCNLGHCFRKIGDYAQANFYFLQVVRETVTGDSANFGLAIVAYHENNLYKAVDYLHQVSKTSHEIQICRDLLDLILEELARRPETISNLLDTMLDESNIDFELQKQLEDFETRDSSENGSVDSNWNSHLEASRPSNHVSASRPNSITARLKIRSRRSVTIDDLSDEPSPIAKRGLLDFMGVGSNRQTTPPPRGSPFTFGSTKLKDLSSSERSDEMDLDDLI